MQPKPVLSTVVSKPDRQRLLRSCVVTLVTLALVLSMVSLAFAASASFPDVLATHPYIAAITDLASRGVIGGYPDGRFGPDDLVTRQQFAKMIVLAGAYPVSEADVCQFVDVARSDATTLYPDNYVAVCAARGITTGKTSTIFDPYGHITRLQTVSMVVRAADDLRPGLLAAPPAGWAGNSTWTNDPTHGPNAARAQYNGLLAGLDLAALNPSAPMTRGEVAQVLHNLLGSLAKTVAPGNVALAISMAAGSGTVTLNPEKASFTPGESVTLTAVPASGYTFAGWSGDAGGSVNPLTVVMNTNKSVTALFTPTVQPFENLGGTITSAPAACSQTSGLLDVFARSSTGTLLHKSWDGSSWSDWEDLGGSVKPGTDPAAVSWGPGRLDVFIRGTDDVLWHKWWDGGTWSDWESLGGITSGSPAATYRDTGPDQRWLDVFILTGDGRLQRRTFDGTAWTPWTDAGQYAPDFGTGLSPAAVTWGRTRIDLFVPGTDGALWHAFLSPEGDWSPWESVGGQPDSTPSASSWGSWAENRLDVFVRGTDNGLWHRSVVSGLWTDWENLGIGAIASAPAAVSWGPDRIDLFVRGTDNTLWHKWWDETVWRP